MRFSTGTDDLVYLPDKVCVMDERAKKDMIAEGIPEDRIIVTGNPYFEHFTDGITNNNEDKYKFLFISQPISTLPDTSYQFTEYEVLEGVCTVLEKLPTDYHLSIRLHPRDDIHKYERFLSNRITLSNEDILEKDLSQSRTIIGMCSPVLMQAALAGKRVIRYIPHTTTTFDDVFGYSLPVIASEELLFEKLTSVIEERVDTLLPSGWLVPGATENIVRLVYSPE